MHFVPELGSPGLGFLLFPHLEIVTHPLRKCKLLFCNEINGPSPIYSSRE